MKIKLLVLGKTDNSQLQSLIDTYSLRLRHYVNFDLTVIPDLKNVKNLREEQQKEKEGELLLKNITPSDTVILLDEKGRAYRSVEFSAFLQKKLNSGLKQLVLIVGGPYGFSKAVYARANQQISLSKMTFSHQMVRLFIVEQLYRGFSILRNEPYHHE